MKRYVINVLKDERGEHEVHESNCIMLPAYPQQKDLGYHYHSSQAIAKARETYSNVSGCEECMRVYQVI